MPTLKYATRCFNRPPIFYVSRQKASSADAVSIVSRYSVARVENITTNLDDQASTAVISFPCERHDDVNRNVVGDQIKIRLAQFENLPSEVIFRGVVIEPNYEISEEIDRIAYNCVGFRYVLNSDVVWGSRKIVRTKVGDVTTESVIHDQSLPAIFNQDDTRDRSAGLKVVNGFATFVFDKDNDKPIDEGGSRFWTVGDIIRYIFAVEVRSKVPTACNVPDIKYLTNLNFTPKQLELQSMPIATAITETLRQMGPAYHWWLDDFFANLGGAQSNFKWFVIGGKDARDKIVSNKSIQLGFISDQGTQRRVFSIGQIGEDVGDHNEYNVNSLSVSENGSDLINRIIIVGDFVRVETTLKLVRDWTAAEETAVKDDLEENAVLIDNPHLSDSVEKVNELALIESAQKKDNRSHVFRSFKLDGNEQEVKDVLDNIESALDTQFGAPTDIFGTSINWFDRNNLPPFDRNLATKQTDIFGRIKNIRMQVYGFNDYNRKEPDKTKELIPEAFVSWSLGTGNNSYVIDPNQPKIFFKKINAGLKFSKSVVYITAVLKTNVRLFFDSGILGNPNVGVTRIIEDTRFKRIFRFKSLVPGRAVDPDIIAQKAPDKNVEPIVIKTYTETFDGSTVPRETGYINPDDESLFDDISAIQDYAEETTETLKTNEISVSIRVPFASATYKPGELIKNIRNSKYKRLNDLTITSISINGVDFSTEIGATNKKE